MVYYRHLFFDLDRTLWDYDKNSSETLAEILEALGLMPALKNFEKFRESFDRHNDKLWELYRNGLIQKDILRNRRFELTLNDFGISDPELARKLNDDFLRLSPNKTRLMEGTIETLTYLKAKKYHIYIITNGFTHIQNIKLKESGLDVFVEQMFTSDRIGANKPQRRMFEFAVKAVNAKKTESLMIGDDLQVDILGAGKFGIDQVYYNPKKIAHSEKPTYEITHLVELMNIL